MSDQEQSASEASAEEPKLTPLQRVKQQQAMLQKNRSQGSRKNAAAGDVPGATESPNQRVPINRRSGASGS